MPCDKTALLEFLKSSMRILQRKLRFSCGRNSDDPADLKPSTMDIDFTIPSSDSHEFERALKNNPSGYKIGRWTDGCVFCQTLPRDYIEKASQYTNSAIYS